jgi:hypothetical protein
VAEWIAEAAVAERLFEEPARREALSGELPKAEIPKRCQSPGLG